MQFKRCVDLWLFENDVGKGDYVGRWAIHAYARAGYGSNPDSYDLLAITDEKETGEFDLEITGRGDFVNRCVFLLGSIGALLSNADVERIGKFWNEIQSRLTD